MGRPPGKKNADHAQSRQALLVGIAPLLMRPGGVPVSLREMASAAGVSVPTLLHYFGDRETMMEELLAHLHQQGQPFMDAAARTLPGPLPESARELLLAVRQAWELFGIGRIFTAGLVLGLDQDRLGPACVRHVLEPTLQMAEQRLGLHQEAGELAAGDLRLAALELLGPLILALLHQGPLGGSACRPLELEPMLEEHLARFVRAWSPEVRAQARPA
jgi:AcrR family transcriptional regulator